MNERESRVLKKAEAVLRQMKEDPLAVTRVKPEEIGFVVAMFLNGRLVKDPSRTDNPILGDRHAVAELVRQLQRLETLTVSEGDSTIDVEIEKMHGWLDSFFDRYVASPRIRARRHSPSWEWDRYWKQKGDESLDVELLMVDYVSELLLLGRMSALKPCARCGDWLFARFSHQRFCSDDCYKQFHKANEADKRRRAKWARDHYRKSRKAASNKKRGRLRRQS
jgi:hypothetical protein